MKYKVISWRPRTDRFGDPHGTVVRVFDDLKSAGIYLGQLRKVHEEMLDGGYPWNGGEFDGFQTQPNEVFFIALGKVPFRKDYRGEE